jgi:glycosyltransferase involved in cell wall biosynthesis
MIRVLLYGDVDLNLIDGSAIWLSSLAEVLGAARDVSVTVVQKTRITRDVVIRTAASLPNVHFLDPWAIAADAAEIRAILPERPTGRLAPHTAAALIASLDRQRRFDVVLIRSLEVADLLAAESAVAPRLWAYVTDPLRHSGRSDLATLRRIGRRVRWVMCQTDEAKEALAALLGHKMIDKVLLLPPMIPAIADRTRRTLDPGAPRLGYSGKFSPPYLMIEMLDAFDKIRSRISGAEFHVVGDKFHNAPPVEGFVEAVTRRLSNTPGVVWHGGVCRHEANAILEQVHVASSWRAPAFDPNVEMSTKVLEYAALGIPVLMNPSSVQRRVFGPDYPAYVTTEAEFIDRFLALTGSPEFYRHVSEGVRQTAAPFSFESHRQRLLPILRDSTPRPKRAPQPSRRRRQPVILWVGHDFKFLQPIREAIERGGDYRSLTDVPNGHVIGDPGHSRALLQKADLIFCEWCLGNAEWYSLHKHPQQRLLIRLHRQEIELPFLQRIRWENVDRIIFVTDWVRDRFFSTFPGMNGRGLLIHNAVDCASLRVSKLPEAGFNLGLLGFCPKLKAPHRAFDLLVRLKEIDRRYTLFIKGTSPRDLAWLWKRLDERRYYQELDTRIQQSPYANSVVFDPPGNDVSTWLSKVGFILSTSDLEGSHQAVAEGMASGAIPVIRDWSGGDALYPRKYIFSSPAEAVELIRKWNTREHYEAELAFCREWAQRYDLPRIAARYAELIAELLGDAPRPASAERRSGSKNLPPAPHLPTGTS